MKKSLVALFVGTLSLLPTVAVASFPPEPRTLEQRVELATHVVIGAARKVTAVEFKDGKLEEMNPQPTILEPRGQYAEIQIEIEESLYPLPWKEKKTVRYVYGGGWFELESIRKGLLNKQLIYLMIANPHPDLEDDEGVFLPSYEQYLAEPIEAKPEIQALLAERVKREEAEKAKKSPEK